MQLRKSLIIVANFRQGILSDPKCSFLSAMLMRRFVKRVLNSPQRRCQSFKQVALEMSGAGPDLGGSQGAQGPRPPTKRGPPTKPFNFYFAITIG